MVSFGCRKCGVRARITQRCPLWVQAPWSRATMRKSVLRDASSGMELHTAEQLFIHGNLARLASLTVLISATNTLSSLHVCSCLPFVYRRTYEQFVTTSFLIPHVKLYLSLPTCSLHRLPVLHKYV